MTKLKRDAEKYRPYSEDPDAPLIDPSLVADVRCGTEMRKRSDGGGLSDSAVPEKAVVQNDRLGPHRPGVCPGEEDQKGKEEGPLPSGHHHAETQEEAPHVERIAGDGVGTGGAQLPFLPNVSGRPRPDEGPHQGRGPTPDQERRAGAGEVEEGEDQKPDQLQPLLPQRESHWSRYSSTAQPRRGIMISWCPVIWNPWPSPVRVGRWTTFTLGR